jgi:rubrerythrin
METEYWVECEVCGVETEVVVLDEEEVPQHCPMCGSVVEYEEIED